MTEIHPSALGRFVRSIAVLAMSSESQLAYLVSIGVPNGVDELALEFDDGRLLAHQFMELGWFPSTCGEAVETLNALLEGMSGECHAELWTTSALSTSSEWARVRSLAKDLLFSI